MGILNKVRAYALIPLARVHWASARDAQRRRDWEGVVSAMLRMHRCGWETDESLWMLGMAYAHLGLHAQAIEPLERIDTRFEESEVEQARWLNLSTSYYHVGRYREALALLPPADEIPQVFPDYAEPALRLRMGIEEQIHRESGADSESNGGRRPR